MRKLILSLLVAAFVLVPSLSKAQTANSVDTQAAYVAALQQVIVLLQQQMQGLVAQLAALTAQQQQTAEIQDRIVKALDKQEDNTPLITTLEPSNVVQETSTSSGNVPVALKVSMMEFENSSARLYVVSNKPLDTTSIKVIVGQWVPDTMETSRLQNICVNDSIDGISTYEKICTSYDDIRSVNIPVSVISHRLDQQTGENTYRLDLLTDLKTLTIPTSADTPMYFKIVLNSTDGNVFTSGEFRWLLSQGSIPYQIAH